MPATHARPDPDALLRQVVKQGRGRLKLFLGAMPGVGKTYEMLLEASDKRREGVDVVIGVVEHHGRRETQSLTQSGLEILPRRQIEYRGQVLKEMDLDAILKRRPALVLVDELAHTNVEGSRHPKRWMDVAEILDAGIDVYSTMNVQHLESVNDIVAGITHVQVRETVPDSVLDLADDIEVVDITPEELQQRLREGKIYPADVASRALTNFFTVGNITAMRELALRRTAERVDTAMRASRAERGIGEVWGACERVVAAIDSSPAALTVVRRAKRLADRLGAPWTVVHVQASQRPQDREQVLQAYRLAEDLGAQTRSLAGGDGVAEILDFARRENATHIVIGSASRPLWIELLRGSFIRRLVRGAGDIAIEIVPREDRPAMATKWTASSVPLGSLGDYAAAASYVAAATAFAVTLDRSLAVNLPNISLVYVLAVAAASIRSGVVVAIATAIASALAYNFFLIPPLYTFTIADPSNVYANVFFIAVALVVSGVAARAREQTLIARRQARQASDLQDFARALVAADDLSTIGPIAAETAAKLLSARTVLLAPGKEGLNQIGEAPGPEFLGADDDAAARWALTNARVAGRGSDTLTGARWLFVPVPGEKSTVAIFGIRPLDDASRLDPEERRLLDQIAAQTGIALDRARLSEDAARARIEAEGERLKGALLDSVGHDLKTPLTTVKSALESLETFADRHDAQTRAQLFHTARSECDRLARFVDNLLEMNRIEAGVVRARVQPCEVSDLVDQALTRVSTRLAHHRILIDMSSGLPSVLADATLFEGALANVLENASKYAPTGSAIIVRAYRQDGEVAIEVVDEGPGLDPAAIPNLFGKFVRGVNGDGRAPGTGLGLAIAKGFLEAQGGRIFAENRSDRSGALFRILAPEAE
jgi:two-component system, OmpR family, sensor histidine kinase KdpD